jgi:spermidine synthase
MGYTLAAALRQLGPNGQVVVAELCPAVVRWNRGPLASLAGSPLEDRRVTLQEEDVGKVLQAEHGAYDAIVLDVDNGPEGLTRKGNDWLYARAGLAAAFAALRPAGVLSVWSASPNKAFTHRLRWAGFHVDCLRVPAGHDSGRQHTIWIASRRT